MQRKNYKTSLLVSVSILSVLSMGAANSCSGPKVTPCISAPQYDGCVKKDQSLTPYDQTDNWVMFSPDDAQKLLNACKGGGSGKED
jgi:hypothetical protein